MTLGCALKGSTPARDGGLHGRRGAQQLPQRVEQQCLVRRDARLHRQQNLTITVCVSAACANQAVARSGLLIRT